MGKSLSQVTASAEMGRVAGLFMNVVLGEGILIQILTMV